MNKVILSTTMLLEEGNFTLKKISLDEAKALVSEGDFRNFSGHQTVKLLGIEPSSSRDQCEGFDLALVLKPNGRLAFGQEYSVEEILAIGVTPFLIVKA